MRATDNFIPEKKSDGSLRRLIRHKKENSYWGNVRRQFAKNKLAVWSIRFIGLLFVIALFSDILANEKPIFCKYKGKIYAPVFTEYLIDLQLSRWPAELLNVEWRKLDYEWTIFPLIPYLPQNLDRKNEHGVSPFAHQNITSLRWRHWLGTDELGRDILAGMLHGTRIALSIGIVSMGIALFIGLIAGSLAGFFGDDRLVISRARLFLNLLFGAIGFFYAFGVRFYALRDALADSFFLFCGQLLISIALFSGILYIGNRGTPFLKRIPYLSGRVRIPVDILISRVIEIMVSVPTLFLIISITAIVTKPSIFIVMLIIGLTAWTGIARFVRAELLRIRNLEYIEAARALGFWELRILLKHALPNALSPVLIALAFGIASSILTESLLSFLGIGVPAETITWGSMLSMAKQTPTAWWIALFPGIAIFLTVMTYNLVGEGLTDAMDPRLKK
jgi:peptide/nickel transport system permease protein